jgi:hypothetical protein
MLERLLPHALRYREHLQAIVLHLGVSPAVVELVRAAINHRVPTVGREHRRIPVSLSSPSGTLLPGRLE